MKISLILLSALLLNTTLLFAEPLFALVKGIDLLIFLALEGILIIGYWLNRFLGNFSRAIQVNFGNLEVFVYKKKK